MEEKNKEIVKQLISCMQKTSVQVLHQNLKNLDSIRYSKIVNVLKPQKFKELVDYAIAVETYPTIWKRSQSIRNCLLDVIDPIPLIKIGAKGLAGDNAWGSFNYERKDNDYSTDLSEYLSNCPPIRLSAIITSLVESTKKVTAPINERDRDIFRYTKDKEFPFEVIDMLHRVHPQNLFCAMGMMSKANVDRIFWLIKKFITDDDPFESVFCGLYGKNYHFVQSVFELIGKHIAVLPDELLLKFLNSFGPETQYLMMPDIGRERIVKLHFAGFSIKGLYIPNEWKIFPDDESNEKIIKLIESGGVKSLNRLPSSKKMELLGALL